MKRSRNVMSIACIPSLPRTIPASFCPIPFSDQMTSHHNEAEEVVNGSHQDEAGEGLEVHAASYTLNKDVLGLNFHHLHFGTKEAPAVVQSLYNRKIVGCSGGTGVSEGHDMVWFWLEKDKPHECAVCSQFFKLEVVDMGGEAEVEGGHCQFKDHQ